MTHSARFLAIVDDAKSRIDEITVEEVLADRDAYVLIDTREDREFAIDRCAGAVHLGKGILERDIEAAYPDLDTPLVLYCGGGFRSALAADALQRMGYRRVWSLAGGIKRWRAQSAPLEAD